MAQVDSTQQEQAWIEAAGGGDRAAFGHLVQAYQRPVYNLTYRMLGDAARAEEAAQETFVRAYTKLDKYDPAYKFSNWILSIASHYCIDRLRRRRLKWLSLGSENLPPAALASPQLGPEQRVIEAEHKAEIQAMLQSLPADDRAALVLHYWHDLSYDEIAKATDSTVSAVKSRLYRARRKLAQQMQTEGMAPLSLQRTPLAA
jgi:RNA polymerase sigma-70 factor (ECF subfamily)